METDPSVRVRSDRGNASVLSPLDRVASRILPRLDELGARGTMLTPVLLVALFSLLAVAGIDPTLAVGLGGDSAREAVVRRWVLLLGLLGPLAAIVKGLLLGSAAWAVLVLAGAAARLGALVSAVLYGEVLLALQGVWFAVVLNFRMARGTLGPATLHVPSGLDVFGLPADVATAALFQGFSAFHVAWVVWLTVAFAAVASTTRSRGALAAGVVWFLVTGFAVLRASLA